MSNIKPLPYRKVTKKLKKLGFVLERATGGSHEVWWSEEKQKTCIVPRHKEVKAGTIRSILKQAEITEKGFLNA